MFDSSVKRGKRSTFRLDRVIKGWTEGLQLMVVGEKRRFWIPSELAYGKNGRVSRCGGSAKVRVRREGGCPDDSARRSVQNGRKRDRIATLDEVKQLVAVRRSGDACGLPGS